MKAAITLSLLGALASTQDTFTVDDQGFIRNWLVLAPIACEGEDSGAAEIDKEQIKDEAKIKPKEGDKVTAGGKELAWKKHKAAEHFIDFLASFGQERGEDVIGYAVAYLVADEELKDLKLLMGSNDQAKVYVNGHPYLKFTETRTLEKDQDAVEGVMLRKGSNVVVFKVINEKNNWQGCLRFTTKGGAPVKSLKVSLRPD